MIGFTEVWDGTVKGIPQPDYDRNKLNKINEQWVSFKVWCRVKGKNPNHGASVREYCIKFPKEMNS